MNRFIKLIKKSFCSWLAILLISYSNEFSFVRYFCEVRSCSLLIGLLSGLAEVERSLTRERTIESIQYRRERLQSLGGRPKTSNAKQGLVLRLRNEGCSYRSIREQISHALSTIRRIIVEQEAVAV